MHKVLKAVHHNISWIPDPQTFEQKIRNMELKNKMDELLNHKTTQAQAKLDATNTAADVTKALSSKLSSKIE